MLPLWVAPRERGWWRPLRPGEFAPTPCFLLHGPRLCEQRAVLRVLLQPWSGECSGRTVSSEDRTLPCRRAPPRAQNPCMMKSVGGKLSGAGVPNFYRRPVLEDPAADADGQPQQDLRVSTTMAGTGAYVQYLGLAILCERPPPPPKHHHHLPPPSATAKASRSPAAAAPPPPPPPRPPLDRTSLPDANLPPSHHVQSTRGTARSTTRTCRARAWRTFRQRTCMWRCCWRSSAP